MIALSAWGQRSDQFVRAGWRPFSNSSQLTHIVIESAAGPVTVSEGKSTLLRASSSWLVRGPTINVRSRSGQGAPGDEADRKGRQFEVDSACHRWFPCRASLQVEIAERKQNPQQPFPPRQLSVRSAGTLSVEEFEGAAVLVAIGDKPIVLGRVAGTLDVAAGIGGVTGFAISSTDVEVRSIDGPVDLSFIEAPGRLNVVAGNQPVILRVPGGEYVLTVNGDRTAPQLSDAFSIDAGIVPVDGVPNRIEIESTGLIELRKANLGR